MKWLTSNDLDLINNNNKEQFENINHYLHGYCHEWVINHYKDGDIAIVILQTDIDTGNKYLLHSFIKRNDKYIDVRGITNDITDILEEFDEGEDDEYFEFVSKKEFIDFTKTFIN